MPFSYVKSKIKTMSTGAKSAFVYTFATLFSKGLAIITVPIFTRIMSPAEIGEVNLYNSWYAMISVVTTLSLTSGGFMVAMKEFKDERDRYMSSVLTITSGMSLIVSIVYAVNPQFWSETIGLPSYFLVLMLIGFLVAPARDFWLARQRYEYKYKKAALLTIASAVVATALSVGVVLLLNKKGSAYVVEGRLFSNYLIVYGVALVLWISVMAKGKTFFNKRFWKMSLALSIPLIGHALASQVLSVSDRMMINNMVGASAVGIYSTLYTVSSISLLVWGAINSSFVPFLYQNIEDDAKRTAIAKMVNALIGLYAVIAVLFTFFAPEIVKILATNEYYEAIYIMPPIAAGVFLTAISNVYSNVLLYCKKSAMIMISSATAALLNVVLNLAFIPIYGYMAAAYTTLISYIVMAVVQGICANIAYKNKTGKQIFIYNNSQMFAIALTSIAVSLSGLIWYRYTVVRYTLIVVGAAIAAYLYKKYKADKSNK